MLRRDEMRHFVEAGYVTVQTGLAPAFHQGVRRAIDRVFAEEGNPGNDILPKIPALWRILRDRAVVRVLEGVLGPGYWVHPHRHCHQNPPGSPGQQMHQDSYEQDQNVRHHRCRWAMAFYYPQDVDAAMGPSSVVPGSHFFTEAGSIGDERALVGPAGSVTVVHYELWHRAMANLSDQTRYMVKFLFCRMQDPGVAAGPAPNAQESLWRWYGWPQRYSHVQPSPAPQEKELNRAYGLAAEGRVEDLLGTLLERAEASAAENLEKAHTNPSQTAAGLALASCGQAAVGALLPLLQDKNWPRRALAADILGDIGSPAREAASALVPLLEDGEVWVRRNAAEALGIMGAAEATTALAGALEDDDIRLRHNAALALGRIGPPARAAAAALQRARAGEEYFVSRNAALALERLRVGL